MIVCKSSQVVVCVQEEFLQDCEEEEYLSPVGEDVARCSVCLLPAAQAVDGREGRELEECAASLLTVEGHQYHSGCINFWCNIVKEKIPTL